MVDIFKNKPLVDRFGHTKAWVAPTGEIKDFEGHSTLLRVDLNLPTTGFHAGDTTWFTTIGRLDREGRVVDSGGSSIGLRVPFVTDTKKW